MFAESSLDIRYFYKSVGDTYILRVDCSVVILSFIRPACLINYRTKVNTNLLAIVNRIITGWYAELSENHQIFFNMVL